LSVKFNQTDAASEEKLLVNFEFEIELTNLLKIHILSICYCCAEHCWSLEWFGRDVCASLYKTMGTWLITVVGCLAAAASISVI
jgi:hypothetical protein